jgi:hypothetical protein
MWSVTDLKPVQNIFLEICWTPLLQQPCWLLHPVVIQTTHYLQTELILYTHWLIPAFTIFSIKLTSIVLHTELYLDLRSLGEDVGVGFQVCNATWNSEQPWRWKQYVPPKHWYLPRSPHGFAIQKTNVHFIGLLLQSYSHYLKLDIIFLVLLNIQNAETITDFLQAKRYQ